jgi:glycosyltransferase involved in cell wall biosynthesis
MKVVQVIEALTRGGAERLVVELAREFRRRGVESRVLCLSAPGPWAAQIDDGLYAGCIGKRRGMDLAAAARLKRRIGELGPDIVQAHLYTANLWTRVAGLFGRQWGLVATLHNVDSWRSGVHIAADRVLAGAADHYVAVSRAVGDYYGRYGLGPERVRVIANGIHSNGEAERPALHREVPVIRGCGRLVENKGFEVLIEAAALLKTEGRAFVVEIAGEGPERPRLEEAIEARGLQERVRLLGDRDDARELIADADVFVLPSFNEGLPLVVLEALHAGRPLVASDLPGLRGVVVDGESGILVPAGSAQALAGAIGTLIDNPEAARMLGRAGRAHAREEFSIERTAASYLELYSQVLDRRRG